MIVNIFRPAREFVIFFISVFTVYFIESSSGFKFYLKNSSKANTIIQDSGKENMATLFTKIISGEIPCHKILEDERYFSFLDIRPINPGHTLVIPKKEVDYIFDIEDDLLSGMWLFSKKVARAIKKAVLCQRVGIMVAGLEVSHAHIHLVPFQSIGDLTFARAKSADDASLARLAAEIVSFL